MRPRRSAVKQWLSVSASRVDADLRGKKFLRSVGKVYFVEANIWIVFLGYYKIMNGILDLGALTHTVIRRLGIIYLHIKEYFYYLPL